MWDFLFNSLWGWLGIGGAVAIGAFAVAWFFPPFRNMALAIGGAALTAAAIYAKGNRDRAKLEQRRKDEAVRKVKEKYDAIDKRQDTPDIVTDRLKRGDF